MRDYKAIRTKPLLPISHYYKNVPYKIKHINHRYRYGESCNQATKGSSNCTYKSHKESNALNCCTGKDDLYCMSIKDYQIPAFHVSRNIKILENPDYLRGNSSYNPVI